MSSGVPTCKSEKDRLHAKHPGWVLIQASDLAFTARLEVEAAPRTCASFQRQLPLNTKLLHCRWSGEGVWIPLALRGWDPICCVENPLSHPKPGQLLLYGAGVSEPELLIPYGDCIFNSRFGELIGNHFLTIVDLNAQLAELGHLVLWHGAQDCRIELLAEA
jgi:Protein of unknown function (DUF3830)